MEAEASWQHKSTLALQKLRAIDVCELTSSTEITWIGVLEGSRMNCDLAILALDWD